MTKNDLVVTLKVQNDLTAHLTRRWRDMSGVRNNNNMVEKFNNGGGGGGPVYREPWQKHTREGIQ